jgi:hypothetical protein
MSVIAFFSGRRGEIRWEKQNVLGTGGRLDYDCYEAFGVVVPLYLRRLVHTSGWGQRSDTCNALELRPDRSFAVQALLSSLFLLLNRSSPFCPLPRPRERSDSCNRSRNLVDSRQVQNDCVSCIELQEPGSKSSKQ